MPLAILLSLPSPRLLHALGAGVRSPLLSKRDRRDSDVQVCLALNERSGYCRLVQDYAVTAIGSIINAHTSSGSVYHGTLLGYTETPLDSDYFTYDNGVLGSNINFDIDLGSGNIYLLGGYN